MEFHWSTLIIVVVYLLVTTLLGLRQSRKVKESKDLTLTRISLWRAATFLAGYTLGGGATYGVAGDTVKFGLTYLIWFPLSVSLGWWLTGLLFARVYYRAGGVTVPTLIEKLFDRRARLACSISTLLYAVFVIILELFTLAIIIRALVPGMSMPLATLISLIISVCSVAFSGILGASLTNLVHSGTITLAFALSLAFLWRAVGGWDIAIHTIMEILPSVASPGVDSRMWLSGIGLGWGVAGQLLLGKSGRMGSISVVSNLAASLKSEKEAVRSFWLAGILSGVPPLLASATGVMTAAFLGSQMANLPAYSAIGIAVGQLNPWLAGLLMAAVAAAILSAYGPTAIVLSSVFIEDILKQVVSIDERQHKLLFSGIIILVSSLGAMYVAYWGISDLLPFLYKTAFPATAPMTTILLFGIYVKQVDKQSAFWAVICGVTVALTWGLVFNDPWGIPNIYLAFLVPTVIMLAGVLRVKLASRLRPADKHII